MKTARLIKRLAGTWSGDARLFQLSKPLDGNEFVVVSATNAHVSGPETYIFGSDKDGNVTDWGELVGSLGGALDHESALSNAGYKVEKSR